MGDGFNLTVNKNTTWVYLPAFKIAGRQRGRASSQTRDMRRRFPNQQEGWGARLGVFGHTLQMCSRNQLLAFMATRTFLV